MKKWEMKHLLLALFLCMAFVVVMAFGAFALGGCAGTGRCFGEVFVLLVVAFVSLGVLVGFLFAALDKSDEKNVGVVVTLSMAVVFVGIVGFCLCLPCNPARDGGKPANELRTPVEKARLVCDCPDPCGGKNGRPQVENQIHIHMNK